MRHILLGLCLAVTACGSIDGAARLQSAPPAFDSALASRLGADERGMRRYVLVILKTGPNTTFSETERNALFTGHFANIQRLAEQGTLVVAGPLSPNERQYRGIYVFAVETVAEVTPLVATDPAVAAGMFSYEAYPWYGSAALMETTAIHKRLQPSGTP